MNDLSEKLTAARKRLGELQATEAEATLSVRRLETDLASTQAAAKEAAEIALIEGRGEPDRPKAIEALTAKLRGAQARANTARGAVARQRTICDSLQADITATRHADVLRDVRPLADKLISLMDEAGEVAIQVVRAYEGEYISSRELFPSSWRTPQECDSLALSRAGAMQGLIDLVHKRAEAGPDAPALRRRLGWEREQAA